MGNGLVDQQIDLAVDQSKNRLSKCVRSELDLKAQSCVPLPLFALIFSDPTTLPLTTNLFRFPLASLQISSVHGIDLATNLH